MSRTGLVFLAVIFGAALGLPFLGQRGYRKIDSLRTLEKAVAAVRRDFPEARSITGEELESRIDGTEPILLFDVRSEEEFRVSRIPHAVHDPEGSEASAVDAGDAVVILYDSHGARSAERVQALARQWGTKALYLEGGIFLWANEGRPLVDAEGPVNVVHPFNRMWGRLLRPEIRARL